MAGALAIGLLDPAATVGSLLATLFGQGRAAAGALRSDQPPALALSNADKFRDRDMRLTAAKPEVKRAVDAFAKAVRSAATPDALLRDPAALDVILTANGLGDMVPRAAMARKALLSDLSDPKSLANTLTDPRWKQAAQTLDFARRGLAVVRDPRTAAKLADAYAEVKWRHSLDAATPGLSNALTFRARAASVGSTLEILGDPVLREVVTVALGIPKQIAFQSIEAQQKAIDTRLDVAKLKDKGFVEKFAQRYLLEAAKTAAPDDGSDLTALSVRAGGLTA